ncbi:MAG: multiprotein-bridging factor 1 family protein [Candidatus Micrarchaeota archaeon]
MGNCEICGRHEAQVIVLIEGAKLPACRGCASGGKVLFNLSESEAVSAPQTYRKGAIESEEITADYSKKIKNAREQKGINLHDLAKKLNEAENFIDNIEKGKLRPTIKIAKKLEKELGIKLIETTKEVPTTIEVKKEKFREQTLADLLENQKKK